MNKLLVLLGLCLMWSHPSGAQQTRMIDPEAERLLRAACQFLAETRFFSLNAEIWREHVNDDGQKLQFSRVLDMEVKRPDKMHVDIRSPHSDRGFWYDGHSLSVLDRTRNFFSSASMPDSLDATIDASRDEFGIDFPLVDLAITDPYTNAMARVSKARYYGVSPAMGFSCHHLAFTQDNIDWQVWIQAGPQPLIRKFIITHKNEPGAPEFTALVRQWNMTDRISDSEFVFEPPRGAARVQMQKSSGEPTRAEDALKPTGAVEPRR